MKTTMQLCHFIVVFFCCLTCCQKSLAQTILFVITPESKAVLFGQDFPMHCAAFDSADAAAELTYSWEFNQQSILQSSIASKVELFTNHSLLIKSADQSVIGRYRCVVARSTDQSTAEKSPEASVVKAYIESFAYQPESMNVTEGGHVELECVTGYSAPAAVVHWEKDGQRLDEEMQDDAYYGTPMEGKARQKTSRIEFTATPESGGSYVCVAKNTLLNQITNSEPALVTVQALPKPPEIRSATYGEQISAEGQPFLLNCSAYGYPKPEISWFKDNVYLNDTTFVYVLPNGSLYFETLGRSASGLYNCEAENRLGKDTSHQIDLTVAYLDYNFSDRPRDTYAITGNHVTLTCAPPASVPPATVLWYKDDNTGSPSPFTERDGPFPVRQLVQGDLYFTSVQFEDNGKYFCVAYNDKAIPSSRTSAKATLTIEGPPVFVEPPLPQDVIKNQLLHLKCYIKAIPSANIEWYKGSEYLQEGGRITFRNSSQELFISEVNKIDEGEYSCRVANSIGTKESSPVFVKVLVPPEFLQSVPSITTAVLGSNALLKCEAFGDPIPSVVWYKGTAMLSPGDKYQMSQQGLQITSLTLDDESEYTCEASNSAGTESSSGRLSITIPPAIISLTKSDTVIRGQHLAIRCEANGTPQPTISWKFNGTSTLPSGLELMNEGKTLMTSNAASHQTGTYQCVAQNSAGKSESDIYVQVLVPASVTEISGDTVVNQGYDINLVCKVTGFPTPNVSWVKDGVTINPTFDSRISFPTLHSLRILYVRREDAAEYSCRAHNEAGTDSKTVDIQVRETPLAPSLTQAIPVSKTSVNLTWHNAQQNPPPEITHYVIEYKLRIEEDFRTYRDDIPGSLLSFEVDNLRPYTSYVFRIAAGNDIGIGKFSNVVGAQTLETAPSPPRNLRNVYLNSTTVKLQWEVPQQVNGELRMYQLQYRIKNTDTEYNIIDIEPPSLPRQLYTVGDLHPYTTYEFRVRGATIENGVVMWSEFSIPFDITTAANVPAQPPSNVRILAVSPHILQVSWESLPRDKQNGPLRGYRVLYKRSSSNENYKQLNIPLDITSMNITRLDPWTFYDVTVVAYNDIGNSDMSQEHSVRTLPTNPSGYPPNLHVSTTLNTSVTVSWQQVADNERNSEISGYIIQFTNTESGSTESKYVNSPSTLQTVIDDLKPHTEYEIRIQAFTTQVSNGGFGVMSPPITFTTKEGLPGLIDSNSITTEVDAYSITLSWLPPAEPNGRIIMYIVTISPPPRNSRSTQSNQLDGSKSSGPHRRKRQANSGEDSYEYNTEDTTITINDLDPGTTYTISIVAETSAGRGIDVTTVTIETDSSTTTTTEATTITKFLSTMVGEPETTTTALIETTLAVLGGNNNDDNNDDLTAIIAGSVVGAICLILIIIIVVCCICRKKKNNASSTKNGIYFIPPTNFARESIAEINANNLELQQNVINNSHANSVPGIEVHTITGGTNDHTSDCTGYNSHLPSEANTSALQARLDLLRNGKDVLQQATPKMIVSRSNGGSEVLYDLSYTSPSELNLSHIPHNQLKSVHYPEHLSISGLDNPAYEPDRSSETGAFSRGYLAASLSPEQSAEVNLSTRRKNRMKRDTAAIIAAQRDRATSVFDDTEELINNDSVIVYDERTVL